MDNKGTDYRRIIRDEESLKLVMKAIADFDHAFVDRMAAGDDFTVRLEVRGNQGEVIHARVYTEGWKRPHGVEKRVEEKKKPMKPGEKPYFG